jgi:transposase-like protein
MRKYETEFKLEVVQSFLAGEGGAKLLAWRRSIPEEKVRLWVSHYRLHGIDGLRPKRSAYSAQFKLQVLAHRIANSFPAVRSRRTMTSAIPTRSWSGDAISIKAVGADPILTR